MITLPFLSLLVYYHLILSALRSPWRVGDKVYTRTFHRRKDADAFAVTIEADRLKGIVIDPRKGNVTFESVAKKWQTSMPTKRARSRELDEMVLRVHILPSASARHSNCSVESDGRFTRLTRGKRIFRQGER